MGERFFGQLLRNTRENRGITLRQLAKLLGVSPTYISDVELGYRKPPNTDRLERIATILDCDVEKLIMTKALDAGQVTLSFYSGDKAKAELALLLSTAWDSLGPKKVSALSKILTEE